MLPLLAAAGIQAGGSILSSLFGGSAAKKAANQQRQQAIDSARHIDETNQQVNADIIGAGNATASQLRQAAGEATARADESTRQANELLNPYRETGDQANLLLQGGLAAGGDFNKVPTLADLQLDPGYAFRAHEAQKALEGSAAARGGALGGGAIGQILGLNQNLASQEYQNAFDRFRATTNDRFARLNDVAGRGLGVAQQQGGNLIGGARYGSDLNYRSAQDAGNINFGAATMAGNNSIQAARDTGNLLTSGAAAQAAGTVGQANAIGSAINAGTSVPLNTYILRNLLKNPAPTTVGDIRGGVSSAWPGGPLSTTGY